MAESKLIDIIRFHPIQNSEKKLFENQTAYFKNNKKPILEVFDPQALMGIEIEVEGITTLFGAGPGHCWSTREDGSLRDRGREFVSLPIRGRNIPFALYEIEDFFKQHEEAKLGKPNFSPRTSIHVHLNARQLTLGQLISLLITYTVLEPLFFKYVEKIGVKRSSSIFCVPLREACDSFDLYHALSQFGKGEEVQVAELLGGRWKKYCALNLKPIYSFGTVEFRHMGGNFDIPFIIGWINLIQRLNRYVIENPINIIREKIYQLNTNSQYVHFVSEVLGREGELFDKADLQIDLEEGASLIKEFFNCDIDTDEYNFSSSNFKASRVGKFYLTQGFIK